MIHLLQERLRDKMNRADEHLLNTIKEITENGVKDTNPRPKYSDGVPAHTLFTTHLMQQYDVSKGEFPLITGRRLPWKNAIKEILWIYQDQTSELSVLKDKHGIHWWDSWESQVSPGTIGQRYGATVRKYDLVNKLLTGLKEDPYSRRHIIDLWQYEDFEQTDGLLPCAFQTIWTVRGEYLDVVLTQRSSDYLVAGHINQLQYIALQMMVAHEVGLKPGKFTHFIANCHIYDRHLEQAEELTRRLHESTHDANPKLKLNAEGKGFYEITIDDFSVIDYTPQTPQLKFDLGI